MSLSIFLLSLTILIGGLLFIVLLYDVGFTTFYDRGGKYMVPATIVMATVIGFASFFYESIQHMVISWTHPTYEVVDISIPNECHCSDNPVKTMREQGYVLKWMHRWGDFARNETEYVFIRKQNTVASNDSVKSTYDKLVND